MNPHYPFALVSGHGTASETVLGRFATLWETIAYRARIFKTPDTARHAKVAILRHGSSDYLRDR